jgi:hypothetical protein
MSEQDTITTSRRNAGSVVTHEDSPRDIHQLIQLALEKGTPVETLEKLVALHERVADRQAAAEFAGALADFQNACPAISKTTTASVTTQTGTKFTYTYAELSHIAETVRPLLFARGFSYTWDSEMADRLLKVTCKLKHVNGHSETASFASPVESRAGMSDQQKYAAALSYAKRMSLIQVLGITTADPDNDGGDFEPISADQVAGLKTIAREVSADEAKFLSYLGVKKWEEIPRSSFKMAQTALESKRRKKP